MNEQFWPPAFEEWFTARIETADIKDFAYEPRDRRRYNQSGIDKLIAAGIPIQLDVRDFGAVGENQCPLCGRTDRHVHTSGPWGMS